MKVTKKSRVVVELSEQEAEDLKKLLDLKQSIGYVREVVASDRQKILVRKLLKNL